MFCKHWYKYFQFIKHKKIKNISSNIKNLIRFHCSVLHIGYCIEHDKIYYPIQYILPNKKKCLICGKDLLYY